MERQQRLVKAPLPSRTGNPGDRPVMARRPERDAQADQHGFDPSAGDVEHQKSQ